MSRRALAALPFALALLAGGPASGADDLATPPPDAILVKTLVVPATGDVAEGVVRTTGLPVSFDLVEDEGFPIGELRVGERRLGLALLRGRGPDAAILADVNGDGRPSRAEESFPVAVSPWTVRDQAIGLLWKATIPWGGGSFDLTIRDRIGTLSGQWTAKGEGSDAKPAAPAGLSFDPDVPAAVTKPPNTPARVRYATFPVGERTVTVAALRGAKDELTFLVDADGTGDLSDLSRRIPAVAQPLKRGAVRTGTSWTTAAVDVLGTKGVLTAVETLPSIQATADPSGSRYGTANVAGDPYALVLLDGDFDGSYTGASDWWGFAPAASVDSPTNPSRLFEGNRPCFRGANRAWRLLGVRADGTAVLAPFAKAPPVEDYLRERSERVDRTRWFPKFDADREEFVRAQGLDPARPTAAEPVRWRYALSLADARTLAMAEGKPLLVDFEADWCIWCKRLDWIIYPDREVAARLARFTAVKVNVELDPVASFQAITGADGAGWGGLPAVGVFDGDGSPVSFKPTWEHPKTEVVDHVDGFKKPEAFAAALDGAYEAVRARTAGGGGGAVAPGMDGGTK